MATCILFIIMIIDYFVSVMAVANHYVGMTPVFWGFGVFMKDISTYMYMYVTIFVFAVLLFMYSTSRKLNIFQLRKIM